MSAYSFPGYVSIGKINVNYGTGSPPPKWQDVFACKECGALIRGNPPNDGSWLVLHAKWHKSVGESLGSLVSPGGDYKFKADSAGYISYFYPADSRRRPDGSG